MKQLKCENCGATIKVTDENNEFAECPYCKAKYQLNERKDIYIRMDDNTKEILTNTFGNFTKPTKFVIIPIIIFISIMFIGVASLMINHFRSIKELKDDNTEIKENTDIDNIKEKVNKSFFNSTYESRTGTRSKFLTEPLLDDVVTNNKTNKDMLITVIFKDKETTDPDAIIEIKHSLSDKKKYEIKLDYDDEGYVNKVTLEEI